MDVETSITGNFNSNNTTIHTAKAAEYVTPLD